MPRCQCSIWVTCWSFISVSVAICPQGCKNGGSCVAPGICSCPDGWIGGACHTGWWRHKDLYTRLFKNFCWFLLCSYYMMFYGVVGVQIHKFTQNWKNSSFCLQLCVKSGVWMGGSVCLLTPVAVELRSQACSVKRGRSSSDVRTVWPLTSSVPQIGAKVTCLFVEPKLNIVWSVMFSLH